MKTKSQNTASRNYKKVNRLWNPARIKRMYKAGKSVSEIAQAMGYPPNTGQNRTRGLLIEAGLYKRLVRT